MDKHWNNYCTMSIVHFMASPETIRGDGPIIETVTKIAEDTFFGAIELGWIKDPAVRAAVKKVAETAHIQIGHAASSALLLQKLNLNSLDELECTKAVEQLCRSIDEAAEMGAQRVVFLSGSDPGDADRPRALEALVKSVKRVAAYGRDKGIALTLETFDRTVDKKCLIGPSPYAAEFCKTIRADYPDFGLLYDLSHMPLLYETPEALSVLKDYLVHIHVGNAVLGVGMPGYGDQHPRFGWPGGVNDIPQVTEFIRGLFKAGYLKEDSPTRPWIGFEVKPQSAEESSSLVIAGAKRVWQEAWSRA
ncbi:MAG: sugar phosphate isomerase/epimerase family protein [Planctomycetota bacterium]